MAPRMDHSGVELLDVIKFPWTLRKACTILDGPTDAKKTSSKNLAGAIILYYLDTFNKSKGSHHLSLKVPECIRSD